MNNNPVNSSVGARGIVKVTPQMLSDSANQLRQKAANIERILGEVNGVIDSTDQVWKSDSYNLYKNTYGSLRPKYEDFQEAIRRYAKLLDVVVKNFEEAEASIARMNENLQSDYTG